MKKYLLQLLPITLLFLLACEMEPIEPENPNGNEISSPFVGNWQIQRFAIVIQGGAIMAEDAGFFNLQADGKGQAKVEYIGSEYPDTHDIKWSYNEEREEITIDHLDNNKEVFEVKDRTDQSQKWQRLEYDNNGNLEKQTEIILEK
ncbi:MAG: hypothetical protein AAFY71_12485 [Bacteroidota bacterium]